MLPVTTIDCEYVAPDLAAAFLIASRGEAAFVETNTSHAVPRLLTALDAAGLAREAVRYVIVTHVHLDHAGGTSALLAALPHARVLAHPRAARHLIDPSRLVASAKGVYGEAAFARLYGEIGPIDGARVDALEDGAGVTLGGEPLSFLHTRGHANHHFIVHAPAWDTVFTGDTFGLVYPRLQRGGLFAFPSTSPTDFDAQAALASVDRVVSLGTGRVHLTHFGEVARVSAAAEQLRGWLTRSAALVDDIKSSGRDEPFVRAALLAELHERAAAARLTLTPDDLAFLELDLGLNAQGLLAAAHAPPRK